MEAITVAAGEGQATWFLQNHMTVKATAEQTGGAYGLVQSLIAPGASPPLHVHDREDEAFFVLEGELTFRCGERTFGAGPGSYTFLPRGVPHTFVVEGDTPARVLTLVSPGGVERFFVVAGRPAEHAGLPPATPPDVERLRRVAAEYGSRFVGPPLEPRAAAASAAG